jgi:NitT/TauT family transport system permease protein
LRIARPALFIALLILLWETLCAALDVSRFVVPRPSEIAPILIAHADEVWFHGVQTLMTTLLGFVIGIAIGFVLGVLLGASQRLHGIVFPTLIGVNSVPKVAIAPLIILWAGIGTIPATTTSAMIVIFPITVVVSGAVAKIDADMRDILRALGATRLDVLRKIAVPRALPQFFGALKIAVTLAFVGTILSESIAANRGLGYMMIRASNHFDVELVFSGLVTLAAMGIGLYLLSLLVEAQLVGWAYQQKEQK